MYFIVALLGPRSCHSEFHALGIEPIIPPKRGAILHDLAKEPWMKNRNDAIRAIIRTRK